MAFLTISYKTSILLLSSFLSPLWIYSYTLDSARLAFTSVLLLESFVDSCLLLEQWLILLAFRYSTLLQIIANVLASDLLLPTMLRLCYLRYQQLRQRRRS